MMGPMATSDARIFRWLWERGGVDWPSRLMRLAEGLAGLGEPGIVMADRPAFDVPAGKSRADCIVECAHLVIWVEGHELEMGTKGEPARDRLARDLEAARALAAGREYCVLVLHDGLRHHERLLVDGYRAGTWAGGFPHLDEAVRRSFRARIGTLARERLAGEWRPLRKFIAPRS
jgi:hypothetical protein